MQGDKARRQEGSCDVSPGSGRAPGAESELRDVS